MKKSGLKTAAVLSALALMGTSLAGCSKNTGNGSSQVIPTEPVEISEVLETPETWKPVEESDYLEFIEGSATATVKGSMIYALKDGAEYSFEEMKDAIENQYLDTFGDSNPKTVVEIDYAIIDCGNDGVPEMAIRVCGDNAERMDEVDDYYIFKMTEGKLYIVDQFESYYRAWGELNKYGVFYMSGSGGASLLAESYTRVNAEGEHEFIYSAEHEFAMGTPMIYGYELPSDANLPEGYPEYPSEYGNNERVKYSFTSYDYNLKDDSEEFNDYLRQMVYVFHDSEGNLITPSDDLVNLYFEIGVVVTDDDNIEQLIKERLHTLGISEEEMKTTENNPDVVPDWKVAWDGLEPQPLN